MGREQQRHVRRSGSAGSWARVGLMSSFSGGLRGNVEIARSTGAESNRRRPGSICARSHTDLDTSVRVRAWRSSLRRTNIEGAATITRQSKSTCRRRPHRAREPRAPSHGVGSVSELVRARLGLERRGASGASASSSASARVACAGRARPLHEAAQASCIARAAGHFRLDGRPERHRPERVRAPSRDAACVPGLANLRRRRAGAAVGHLRHERADDIAPARFVARPHC